MPGQVLVHPLRLWVDSCISLIGNVSRSSVSSPSDMQRTHCGPYCSAGRLLICLLGTDVWEIRTVVQILPACCLVSPGCLPLCKHRKNPVFCHRKVQLVLCQGQRAKRRNTECRQGGGELSLTDIFSFMRPFHMAGADPCEVSVTLPGLLPLVTCCCLLLCQCWPS